MMNYQIAKTINFVFKQPKLLQCLIKSKFLFCKILSPPNKKSNFRPTVWCARRSSNVFHPQCEKVAGFSLLQATSRTFVRLFGAPGGARIPNLWFRRPTLYPIELRAHMICFFQNKIIIRVCGTFVNKNVNKINWHKFFDLHKMI